MTSKIYIPFVYTTLGVVLLLCHPMNAMLDPEFANISLRIAISVWPPLAFNCSAFPTLVPTKECPFPGFDAENLGIILAHMGITNYSFYVFDKRVTTSGAYVNGTWTNIMGMIMNETVDTICGGYQRTETRSRDFDFAYPMLQIKPVFVVKKRVAGFVEAVMAVFSGFDGQVWLMICSVFAVQVVCIMFIDYVQLGDNHRKLGIWAPGKMVFNMYRLFIMQCDDELKHPTYTGNMLIVIFGIVDILLVSLYQGLLLTQLLYPIEVRPFKDADEMMQRIADKEYSLITYYPGHWYFQELQTSKGEHFVKMRVALRNNPAVIIANQSLVLDMVAAGKYILPIDTDGEVLYYAKHQYCDLTFIEDGLPSQYRHYLFKKNSPWLPLFNNASIGQQSFAINTWEKYFGPRATARDPNAVQVECPAEPPLVRALAIKTLTGLFCIFVCGAAVSVVLFTGEAVPCRRIICSKRLFGTVKQIKYQSQESGSRMMQLIHKKKV